MAAINPYNKPDSPLAVPTSSARAGEVVVPDDSTDLSTVCRGIWVGNGGDVAVIMLADREAGGDTVTVFKSVPSGFLLPICAVRVASFGTTASDMIALS